MHEQLRMPLEKVVAFLENHGYRYAIIGGIALSQWGYLRFTYDIAITVLVPNMNYAEVRAALCRPFLNRRGNMAANPFFVAVMLDEVMVDFLLTLPGYEEQIIERAVKRDLNGFSAWICSAEDLIIQKVVTGRIKDWPDVEALLIGRRVKLDEAYIDDGLAQFAEALENPDILEKYRQLAEKIKAL